MGSLDLSSVKADGFQKGEGNGEEEKTDHIATGASDRARFIGQG